MASTNIQTFLNTGDGAVPATCTSRDPIGMIGDAFNPTTQSLGEVLNASTSIRVHEDGTGPFAQSPGSTPVPPHATQSPQDIPDAEEVPPHEGDSGNKLTVIVQQLLKMVEAAVNPAQSPPPLHLKSSDGTINCVLPTDTRTQLTRAANQPAASLVDWLHAVQVLLSLCHVVRLWHPAKMYWVS